MFLSRRKRKESVTPAVRVFCCQSVIEVRCSGQKRHVAFWIRRDAKPAVEAILERGYTDDKAWFKANQSLCNESGKDCNLNIGSGCPTERSSMSRRGSRNGKIRRATWNLSGGDDHNKAKDDRGKTSGAVRGTWRKQQRMSQNGSWAWNAGLVDPVTGEEECYRVMRVRSNAWL